MKHKILCFTDFKRKICGFVPYGSFAAYFHVRDIGQKQASDRREFGGGKGRFFGALRQKDKGGANSKFGEVALLRWGDSCL